MKLKKLIAMGMALVLSSVTVLPMAQAEPAATPEMIRYAIKDATGKVVGTFSAPANPTAAQLASGLQSGLAGTNYAVSSQLANQFGETVRINLKYRSMVTSAEGTATSSSAQLGNTVLNSGGMVQSGATTTATTTGASAAVGTFSTATVLTGAGLVTIAVAAAGGGSSSTPSTPGTGGTGGTGTN